MKFSLIILITIVCFSPLLKAKFIEWDDGILIYDSEVVESGSIKDAFFEAPLDTYIPLTTSSFIIDKHLFGFNPLGYHLVNIMLHLGVVYIVFLLSQMLGLSQNVGLLAALIFAIHPMHVESVAWITERKDVLYAIFYLLSLISYVVYRRWNISKFYCASFAFFTLAILAKPMALSLPLILILVDWFLQKKFKILDKIPFFLAAGLIGSITYAYNHREIIYSTDSILLWIWSFVFYIQKFLFPFNLSPIYPAIEPVSISNISYILSLIIFLSTIIGLIVFRKCRLWLFALGFYFLSTFFLYRFDIYDTHIVADRFMYLPSIGICFLIAHFIILFMERTTTMPKVNKAVALGLVSLLTLGMGIQTFKTTFVWRDTLTFWDYVISKNEKSWQAYSNRGEEYYDKNEYEKAKIDLTKAIRLHPNDEDYYQRGKVYYELWEYELALNDFNSIVEKEGKGYQWSGFVLNKLEKWNEAIKHFDIALKEDDMIATTWMNRGFAYLHSGKEELGKRDLRKAALMTNDIEEYKMCAQYLNGYGVIESEYIVKKITEDIKNKGN